MLVRLQPDFRDPALQCVTRRRGSRHAQRAPGVRLRRMDQGFIDPKRIGIQGHSWGGYQITHLVTRTNLFAAVEAGASVSDMVSAYGGIRWSTGMWRAFHYEKTQSRIGQPPWDAPLQYIENSPIFWVKKVQTPYSRFTTMRTTRSRGIRGSSSAPEVVAASKAWGAPRPCFRDRGSGIGDRGLGVSDP